ncbi:rod shape-determining protein MreB [Proteinivorax hydrogeniformans]|uniref:Cell shape-determining protein MreB n=1 Tax=Proteinivorax hydrogeniformans TaxID=1826727 RepID=A0AAU8HSR5_9FIRM
MLKIGKDIGVDLGTASVLVTVKGKGIVLNEPSVVAVDIDRNKTLAVGEEARRMLGRTPLNISAIRPLKEGVIADFDTTESMLKHFLYKATGSNPFFKPRVMVCVPAGITSVEQRAVMEAVLNTGAKDVFLIEEPRAAALGADLEIFEPFGNMVIDIGGGTTDVAVISLGDIVKKDSIRVGGDKLDEAIVRFIRDKHNLMIGERTAEEIKIQVATADPNTRKKSIEVRGRDIVSGLPKNLTVDSDMAFEAIKEPVNSILRSAHKVLERTPPELASDIIDKGIVMTGGGAMLHGLDTFLTEKLRCPVFLAQDPISSVVRGTGIALEMLDNIMDTLTSSKKSV